MDFSTHLEFRLPIVVGTVPLRHIPTALPLENGNALPSDLPPALSTIQPLSAEPPPPSYEECMFGEVDARDDADNEPMGRNFAFAPKYPVYRVWTEF
uniref:Uncharacterized protein n=1 Tax=Plectus sambesii TaxID=2011161 RepID=A0A914WEW2_9BILA